MAFQEVAMTELHFNVAFLGNRQPFGFNMAQVALGI